MFNFFKHFSFFLYNNQTFKLIINQKKIKIMLKKLFLAMIIAVVGLFTISCQKDQTGPSNGNYDVSFNINSVVQNGLKSTFDINCSTLKADYAMYKMDNGNFITIPVFYVGDVPYTNSIKLSSGIHILNEFIVYSDNNTPNDFTDDIVLSAAPHTSSIYGQLVQNPLDYTFNVTTDKKNEIQLDVVCYESSTYDNFGFIYFKLNELIVHEQWFFGDFCIKEKADYNNSNYALQPGWVGSGYGDVPAIFKVEVWRGGLLQSTFTNNDVAYEYGNKVSVSYVDYKNQTDIFEFKLFILVREGTSFNFVQFKSWTFNDVSNITEGTDGVVDFVLGNCAPESDYVFPPYMNLPASATYTITGFPSTVINGFRGYVDATLSNIPSGYDIHNGLYASNCADHSTLITIGQSYNMTIYSSLYPEKLPTWAQGPKWDKINWLYNHLDYFPGYLWSDVQGAIWLYDNPAWNGQATSGMPALSPMMTNMKTQMDLYGNNYKVPPGGWAAIIFIKDPSGNSPTIQTMFIEIDP